jgi:formylglycine-generating enzyme required for sulfatase activity
MADVFISYSRKDSEFAQRLNMAFVGANRVVWVDWQSIPRGEAWWREIQLGIEGADAFICVVSENWLSSEVCHKELQYARSNNKRVLPLIRQRIEGDVLGRVETGWQDEKNAQWQNLAHDNWVYIGTRNWIFFDSDEIAHFLTEFNALLKALDEDQSHIKAHTRYQNYALEWERTNRNPDFLLAGDNLKFAEEWLEKGKGREPQSTDIQEEYITESRRIEEKLKQQAEAREKRIKQFRRATAGLAIMVVLAGVAVITAIAQTGQVRAERELFGVQAERVSTLAAGGVIVSLNDIAPTPEAFRGTATAIAKLVDWEPVIQDFDGVEMVQVPAGCFWMGSILNADEQPVHEVCFDKPFWIDRYEVKNRDFERQGGKASHNVGGGDPTHPRIGITWFEAQDFCELRGGELPTEAKWEYAARGPDSLVYPWGNNGTPGGQSWVGADSMGGGVWEWVGTIYHEYPYPTPGSNEERDEWLRENDTESQRVLRGGSNRSETQDYLRTSRRVKQQPDIAVDYGFRCARSDS